MILICKDKIITNNVFLVNIVIFESKYLIFDSTSTLIITIMKQFRSLLAVLSIVRTDSYGEKKLNLCWCRYFLE